VDRIRKALDLARQARVQSLTQAGEPGPQEPGPGSAQPHTAESAPALPGEVHSIAGARGGKSAPVEMRPRTRTFAVPGDLLESQRIMRPGVENVASGAYRMLRTQVLQRMDANGWRTLGVLSPSPMDGKTTTAANLAVSVASDRSHTVLLVEFDFKRPTLASRFGLVPAVGSDDAVLGNAPVHECLYTPEGFERLVLMPARAPLANSSELLAGPRSRELVSELRARYPDRIVLFDLPPVLFADDALAFAPLIECGLVVAAEGYTRRKDLLRTMELLSKTPLVGTVLNRAADAPAGY
jgi:protein-tyrosine kinase